MKDSSQQKTWIDLLSFCLLRVIALSLAFAGVLIGGTLAFAGGDPPQASGKQSQPQKVSAQMFSGVITDSECGARHNKDAKMSSAECAKFCVRNGAKYTLVDGETNYVLNGNAAEFAKLAGQRVKITGTRDGNTIQVNSVSLQ